ncbi:MAG: thioredoxin domain-containing protein [Propionibacteriaceae bacterium]|nr:thioredoxin domain-containing protein [Propionibacteriaceae bacterium]
MSKSTPAKSDSRRAQLRAAQLQQAKRDKNRRIAMFSVIGVVVIALVAASVLLFLRFSGAEATTVPPNATAARDGIVTHPGKAKAGAPKVEIFLDYQCPACARFEASFGPTLDQMATAGDIDLSYRTMTFLDTNLRNDSSTRAANAAACADVTGHYADYHNAIFAHQPSNEGSGYTEDNLTKDFTAQAGITGAALDEFNTCYAEKRFSGFVKNVDNEAGKSGVTGTPSLHVNGKPMELGNLTDAASLRTQIDALK